MPLHYSDASLDEVTRNQLFRIYVENKLRELQAGVKEAIALEGEYRDKLRQQEVRFKSDLEELEIKLHNEIITSITNNNATQNRIEQAKPSKWKRIKTIFLQ